MIYGLNFNNTQLPAEKRAFPETVTINKQKLRIVGMTNNADAVGRMMRQATNGKRILTTKEVTINKTIWWAVYAY